MNGKGLTALLNLNPKEVSVVRAGANRKKRFPIAKKEAAGMKADSLAILKSVIETEAEAEVKLHEILKAAGLSEKGEAAVQGAYRILSSFKDEMPSEILQALAMLAGYEMPPAELEQPEEAEEMEGEKEEEEAMKVEDISKEAIEKALDPVRKAYQAELEALKQEVKKSHETLEKLHDERKLGEWVAKAEAELKFFPGKSTRELGEMLHALAKQSPELADAQFDAMRGAATMIAKSAMLRDAGFASGSFDDANSGAQSELEKMAEGLVAKSSTGHSKEMAVAKSLTTKEGRELYKQYLAEHPQQVYGGR